MERPKEITLSEATAFIGNTCSRHAHAFFFMVGAGVSYPPIPLAPHIIEECKKLCAEAEPPKDLDAMREYSWWFERAFHSPADRQWYLRGLIEKQSGSHANLRLAHLLLSRKITNLVVTTNFDNFVSQSLTTFGEPHIVCDHPGTIQRIDPENQDLQIVHVHGTYWFYDCCNLTGEIEARSEKSARASSSMADFLDRVLSNRSPLIVGYSGWEGDAFMSALRRRLQRELPYNVYWFCYHRGMIQNLPEEVRNHPNIFFVVPDASKAGSAQNRKPGPVEKPAEPVLPASEVLDALVERFVLEAPPLTLDPLSFFANQLRRSLPPDDAGSVSDLYRIGKVINRIERANQNLDATEKSLERVRDALRRSQYREAVVLAFDLMAGAGEELQRELAETFLQAGSKLLDNSAEELKAYQSVIQLGGELLTTDPEDERVPEWVATALVNEANLLGNLKQTKDALRIYDDVLAQFGNSVNPRLRYQAARAVYNKGATQYDQDPAGAVTTYAALIQRFGEETESDTRGLVAWGMYNSSVAQFERGDRTGGMKVLAEIVRRYESDSSPKCQEPVAQALNGIADEMIREAKQMWKGGDEAAARAHLQAAQPHLTSAAARVGENAYVMGSQAYLTFLLGDVARAKELLQRAIELGGEELRKAELDSVQDHPLPVDEAFLRMLEELPEGQKGVD
jgi:tetratricopeptide (TPR) repeat protein